MNGSVRTTVAKNEIKFTSFMYKAAYT